MPGPRTAEAGAGVGQDVTRLAEFLRAEIRPDAVGVEVLDLRRPIGGASWETFIATLAWAEPKGARREDRVVIRRAPAHGPLAPYEVSKDATIFRVLAATDVPVPELLAWTDDRAVFERPFVVTSFVEGESPDLSQVERWPVWQANRERLGLEIIDRLAALQRVAWKGTGIEAVLGAGGDARERLAAVVGRALSGLEQVARRADAGIPIWRDLALWLVEHAPHVPEEDLVVVHGDYRFGNFIWQGTRIAAVIDWERAMLGPPMQDLGFLCMPLSRMRDPKIMGKALAFDSLAERYEASAGRPVDVRQIQLYAVLWQFLEGVNTARALLQERTPMLSSGVLVQPNLIARQTYALIEHFEAGRSIL